MDGDTDFENMIVYWEKNAKLLQAWVTVKKPKAGIKKFLKAMQEMEDQLPENAYRYSDYFYYIILREEWGFESFENAEPQAFVEPLTSFCQKLRQLRRQAAEA
jgi:hypothetical protein